MDKNVTVFLTEAVKNIDIPFSIISKDGITDGLTTPDRLFQMIEILAIDAAKYKKELRSLKKAYMFMSVAAGLGFGLYFRKRKELKKCQEELEMEKALNIWENHEFEDDNLMDS